MARQHCKQCCSAESAENSVGGHHSQWDASPTAANVSCKSRCTLIKSRLVLAVAPVTVWLYLLPEGSISSVACRGEASSAACSQHGIQSQRLEGGLGCQGCKISLQSCLLTAPALCICSILCLQANTSRFVRPPVSFHLKLNTAS